MGKWYLAEEPKYINNISLKTLKYIIVMQMQLFSYPVADVPRGFMSSNAT